MLLDYAAELKCTTQRQIVHTGVALVQLPQNLHALIINLSAQAQSMVNMLAAELHDLRTRKRAKEKKKERLGRTKQQLIQATKLIKQAESLNHTINQSQSNNHSRNQSTYKHVEEEKTQTQAEPQADQDKVDHLSEQIRMLKEQMSLFASLKESQSNSQSSDIHLSSSSDTDHGTDDESVPVAPPIVSQSINQPAKVDRSSHGFASIPIASPMFSAAVPTAPALSPPSTNQSTNHSIPMAPPLGDYDAAPMHDDSPVAPVFDIPCAPSLDEIPAPPAAPAFTPMSPVAPARNVLSEVSNTSSPSLKPMRAPAKALPKSMAEELASRPLLRPRPRPSSVQTRKSSSASSNLLAPPVQCYTRAIPGSENLSHNDLIKVAAKIKLRRTEIPRSPGGTPARKAPKLGHSGGIDQAMLAHALSVKFRDLRRSSVGSRNDDKENDWATD